MTDTPLLGALVKPKVLQPNLTRSIAMAVRNNDADKTSDRVLV